MSTSNSDPAATSRSALAIHASVPNFWSFAPQTILPFHSIPWLSFSFLPLSSYNHFISLSATSLFYRPLHGDFTLPSLTSFWRSHSPPKCGSYPSTFLISPSSTPQFASTSISSARYFCSPLPFTWLWSSPIIGRSFISVIYFLSWVCRCSCCWPPSSFLSWDHPCASPWSPPGRSS